MKVALYETLIRQLQDDGFVDEAQSLSEQTNIEPNEKAVPDTLLDIYDKSLKWAFGDEPAGQWKPVELNPIPPLGAQERILDIGYKRDDIAGSDGQPPEKRTKLEELAAARPGGAGMGVTPPGLAHRKMPEVRLLFTTGHKQACRSVAFSNDGRFCASGSADGCINVLDAARMRTCGAMGADPLGRARLTIEELNKPVTRTLQDHMLGITCLAFHPMNPTLFSGSVDKAVKIFDLTRPPGHKKAFSVLQDVHPVRCLAIHPCGDFLMVGTAHQAVRLYDLQTLNCFTSFHQDHHHSSGINDIRCTSDGRMFATASSDGTIKLWDAVSQRMVNSLPKAHSGASVTSLRWSRGLNYLLSSGADGRCRLWDVRKGEEVFALGFGPRTAEFSTAVFAAGERYVACANSNTRLGDVSLFDSQTGSPVFMKLGMHLMPVHALDASPVDNTLITGCDDDKVRYFQIDV